MIHLCLEYILRNKTSNIHFQYMKKKYQKQINLRRQIQCLIQFLINQNKIHSARLQSLLRKQKPKNNFQKDNILLQHTCLVTVYYIHLLVFQFISMAYKKKKQVTFFTPRLFPEFPAAPHQSPCRKSLIHQHFWEHRSTEA